MVRVNYPAGDSLKLYGDQTQEPQTVRVLKPPGGDSSISFSHEAPRSVSRSNSVQQCLSSPSSSDSKDPRFDSNPAEDKTDAPSHQNGSNGKHSQEAPVDPKPTCDVASEKSPDVNESPVTPSEITVNTPPTHTETESHSVSEEKVSASECNVEKEVSVSDSQTSTECKVEASSTEVSVETSSEISSSTTESHHISKEEVSSTQENGVHVVNGGEKTNNDNTSNGSSMNDIKESNKRQNLPPLAMQHDNSPAQQPLSPTQSPSSPLKQNDDTKDRVFGQPTGNIAPQPVPQQRKIKDHMRSNIFMSDEDYTPTRSSRMNASTVKETKPEAPTPPQRQRIPPGGFSTKLW